MPKRQSTWSKQIGREMAKSEAEKHKNRYTRMLKEFRALDYSKALGKVQKTLQELVRIERANDEGWLKTCCCGKEVRWNGGDCQGGHYRDRQHSGTTIVPDNVWPICVNHNHYEKSQGVVLLRKWMVENLGEDRVNELDAMKSKSYLLEVLVEKRLKWMDEIAEHKKRIGE